MINKKEIENILNTLPIGYYAKRKIEVTLSDSEPSSFYRPMTDQIVISYPQLLPALIALGDTPDESAIRAMLYHEVSHAILTPQKLTVSNAVNIVEDERIETLLHKYYLNVDFKNFVKLVNHYHGESARSADEAFYQLVRYRVGEKIWLDKLNDLLKNFATLNRISSRYRCYDYYEEVEKFYREFTEDWNKKDSDKKTKEREEEKKESKEPSEIKEDSEDTSEEQTEADSEDTLEDKNPEESKLEGNIDTDTPGSDDVEDIASADEVETLVKNAFDEIYNPGMIQEIQTIFSKVTNSNKKNGSSINSYSGTFDPRSVARTDYKYFTQKNRLGHLKTHSKIHLNLYIDRSGSFCESEKTVNQLLYALSRFEAINPDFDFDLVTIGEYEILTDRKERVLKTRGGNCLTKEIHNLVKKLNPATSVNYNIVLFDGDAVSDSYNRLGDSANFRAFDKSNFIVISDRSNEWITDKYCKSAKVVITRNFVEELQKAIFATLHQIVR